MHTIKYKDTIDFINQKKQGFQKKEFALHILRFIDYTSLSTTDNSVKIDELINHVNTQKKQFNGRHVAAICVYPNFVARVKKRCVVKEVKVASVGAAFPHAQSFNEVKILECELAVKNGADEIDMVFPLGDLLANHTDSAFQKINDIKRACGSAHLKVILETDLLSKHELVEKASEIALNAGADFIKTSTGKDGSKANLEDFITMCYQVKKHFEKNGQKKGLKPAGGISCVENAFLYYGAVEHVLGNEWLIPELFRIGASSLVKDIENSI